MPRDNAYQSEIDQALELVSQCEAALDKIRRRAEGTARHDMTDKQISALLLFAEEAKVHLTRALQDAVAIPRTALRNRKELV